MMNTNDFKTNKITVNGQEFTMTTTGDWFGDGITLSITQESKERVIFSDPATIVYWKDGTKTVVKASQNDKFDKRMGYLIAFYQKHCGLTKNKANEYIDKICGDEISDRPLKAGDKVRVLNKDVSGHEFNMGDIVVCEQICNDGTHYFINKNTGYGWYMCESEYERITK